MSNSVSAVLAIIEELRRSPVKSILPVRLDETELTQRGLLGDRAHPLRDKDDVKIASTNIDCEWPLFDLRGDQSRSTPVSIKINSRFSRRLVYRRLIQSYVILILAFGYMAALYLFQISGRARLMDFSQYYAWAVAVREHINPYNWSGIMPLLTKLRIEGMPSNYPPTFLLAIRPLGLLKVTTAFWVWHGLNVLLLFVAGLMLTTRTQITGSRSLFLAAFLLYGPVTDDLYWGQSQLILIVLLWFVFEAERTGRWRIGSVALGLAILVKLFPGILLGHFAVKRKWRFVFTTLSIVAVGGVLGIYLLGSSWNVAFTHQGASFTNERILSNARNISFVAILWRSLHQFPLLDGKLALGSLAGAISLVILLLCARASSLTDALDRPLGDLGLWLSACVLLTPINWFHHMVLLFLPLAEIAAERRTSRVAARLGVVSYCFAELALILLWLSWSNPSRAMARLLQIAIGASAFVSASVCFVATYFLASASSEIERRLSSAGGALDRA